MLNILFGWILGIAGSILLDLWRGRGKVDLGTVYVWKHGAPGWNEIQQLCVEFTIRAINTYSSDKYIAVAKVEFHEQKSNASAPIFVDSFPKIFNFEEKDVELPAKSITRLRVSCASPHKPDDASVRAKIPAVHFVCVEFLVLPRRRMRKWFDLSLAVDLLDPENQTLISAHY